MEFSKNLNSYMNKLGISNYQMSKDTGISDSLIGYWRNGKRKPNFDNLIVISEYLNVSIDFLIRGNSSQVNSILLDSNLSSTESEDTYKNLDNNIGERIASKRKKLGITGQQIKDSIGISTGNLSGIEKGTNLPSATALIGLSKILNCSIDWILTGETPKSEILTTYKLSDGEEELLTTYNKLDRRGQHRVHTIIYEELDRITANESSIRRNAV